MTIRHIFCLPWDWLEPLVAKSGTSCAPLSLCFRLQELRSFSSSVRLVAIDIMTPVRLKPAPAGYFGYNRIGPGTGNIVFVGCGRGLHCRACNHGGHTDNGSGQSK